MAGQAAFDFVFKEMIPEGAKKDAKPSTSQEESPVSAKKVSLKWRPAVSDLASEDEKDPCVDGQPSCSWGSLAKASSKTSLSLQVEDEKFQVQLALEDGKLALEDEVNKKHDDDTAPSGSSKQPACKKKLATACQKKPASKKTDKPKGEECKKKVKASPCTKKSYKVQTDERKTFANRTCPPGPEGSTRFEAIKKAYNEVIKERISRNQEVGFCLLALTVKVFPQSQSYDFCFETHHWQALFWTFCRKTWEGKELALHEYETVAKEAAETWLETDGQEWLLDNVG